MSVLDVYWLVLFVMTYYFISYVVFCVIKNEELGRFSVPSSKKEVIVLCGGLLFFLLIGSYYKVKQVIQWWRKLPWDN